MFAVHGFCLFSFLFSVVKTELTIVETVEQFMYKAEKHQAVTKDGYLLSVYRILPREPGPAKPPVLLMPGLFTSGMDFLVLGPGRALGYLLSAAGYDVWLGSFRGIPGSTGHVNTTVHADRYWDFSLDEISKYDVPAMVDLVLAKTGQRFLIYIGHSMGGTVILMMLAELPRYIQKISMAILLGPVVFISNPDPILAAARAVVPLLQKLLSYSRIFSFPHNYETLRKIGTAAVTNPKGLAFTKRVMEFIFGKDCHLSELVLKGLSEHTPTPSSLRVLQQYSQMIGAESFRKYDWGDGRNLEVYRSIRPPIYDLRRIDTKVFLFQGNSDTFVQSEDTEKLQALLPNSATYLVQASQFAHNSFIYSDKADELVYKHVLYICENKTLPSNGQSDTRGLNQLPPTWKRSDTCDSIDTC